MKKSSKNTPQLTTETVPTLFYPTKEQIDALARRLIPEIKKFFADEQIQKEYAEWQQQQKQFN